MAVFTLQCVVVVVGVPENTLIALHACVAAPHERQALLIVYG